MNDPSVAPDVASCLVHAQVSTGSCSRCGRFVCVTCARFIEGQRWCETCEPTAAEPRPIGGWLVLAMLMLVLMPFRLLATAALFVSELRTLEDPAAIFEEVNREWLMVNALNLGTSLLTTTLACITFVHAVRKRKAAILWFQAVFSTSLVLNALFHVYNSVAVTPAPGERSPWGSMAWSTFVTVLWLRYFQNNERVKQTFVRK